MGNKKKMFLVAYDLHNGDSDTYQELANKLEEELHGKRLQESVWRIDLEEYTCEELKNELSEILWSNDELLVAECISYKTH